MSSPFHIDGVDKVAPRRAPSFGQHNEAVLPEAGYDADEIERLRKLGVLAKSISPASRERSRRVSVEGEGVNARTRAVRPSPSVLSHLDLSRRRLVVYARHTPAYPHATE